MQDRTKVAQSLRDRTKKLITKRWWGIGLAAVVVAVATGVRFTLNQRMQQQVDAQLTSGELDVYVDRGGEVFRWEAQPLRPGDQLRYSFRAPEALHVVVLGRTQDGETRKYFPETTDSWPVERGVTVSKTKTTLDERLGGGTFWAVFCRSAFRTDAVVQELQTSGAISPAAGCATQRRVFIKQAN